MEAALQEPATPENLQERIDEAQKQMAQLQASVTASNAEQFLSDQELLGIQNNTLQKELEDVAKAHLDTPIIDFDQALNVALAAAAKPVTPRRTTAVTGFNQVSQVLPMPQVEHLRLDQNQ